jgi:hypothetical protein
MAIGIENTPSNSESIQDGLWHIVSSNHSAIPDFKYVFDVYIGGVQKIRVKQYPEPGTTYGYFDAGPIIRNSIDYGWFDATAQYQEAPLQKEYQVRYGEEYSGTTTLNLASGTTRVYNWRPDLFKRFNEGPIVDYQSKFFTERNRTLYADFNESLFIGSNYGGGSSSIYYYVYNNSNALIFNTVETMPYMFTQVNLKPILNYALSVNAKYVEVFTDSEVDKLRIYNKCNPKYETVPVHFLNRFGMWDTIHFDLVSRLTMDVERKGFEKRDFIFNGTNVQYDNGYNKYVESKINYSNKMNWSYRLTADAMNDTDYQWASQLINSGQILMEIDSYFYPVTIKNSNYEYSKYVNNRQRALEIDFEMNQTRYSHLR